MDLQIPVDLQVFIMDLWVLMDIKELVGLGIFFIDLWNSYYVDLERAPLVNLNVLVLDVNKVIRDKSCGGRFLWNRN